MIARSILAAVSLASMLLPTGAQASVSQSGKPVNLIANNAGRFFFEFTGARGVRPSCASFDRWVINATTDEGRVMMSLLLTAKAQDKTIVIYGTGDCRDWGDTEAIAHFLVQE